MHLNSEVETLKSCNLKLVGEIATQEKKIESFLQQMLEKCAPQIFESVSLLVSSLLILKGNLSFSKFKFRPGFEDGIARFVEMDHSKSIESFDWLKMKKEHYMHQSDHEWVFPEFVKVILILSRFVVAFTHDDGDNDPVT